MKEVCECHCCGCEIDVTKDSFVINHFTNEMICLDCFHDMEDENRE